MEPLGARRGSAEVKNWTRRSAGFLICEGEEEEGKKRGEVRGGCGGERENGFELELTLVISDLPVHIFGFAPYVWEVEHYFIESSFWFSWPLSLLRLLPS